VKKERERRVVERGSFEEKGKEKGNENLPLSSSTTTGVGATSLTGSACSVVGEVGCEGDYFEEEVRVSKCETIESFEFSDSA